MHDARDTRAIEGDAASEDDHDALRHEGVEALATQVLSALASRAEPPEHDLDAAVLENFCAEILRGDPGIRTDSVADLRRQGIEIGAILDGYIPAAAREMGDRWCRDELSFADVTIGAARLQAILRELSAPWMTDATTPLDAPNVMLIVPLEEFHTLGGMTATSQLRRMGVSVCLCLGQGEEEILQKAGSRRFDMIAVSVSCRQKLDSARKLVNSLRRAVDGQVPIVVGGIVVDDGEDVRALTGADHATADPGEALRLCGVEAPGPSLNDRSVRA